jgi:hypothetical protein
MASGGLNKILDLAYGMKNKKSRSTYLVERPAKRLFFDNLFSH